MMVEYAVLIFSVLAGLFAAFLLGHDRAESKQKDAERKAIGKAKKVSDEQDAKSDDAVRSDATRWVRSDKR